MIQRKSKAGGHEPDATSADVEAPILPVDTSMSAAASSSAAAGSASGSGPASTTTSSEAERQSRIAMNLARLDHASAVGPRTPLQWKGYAWRTFDTVRNVVAGGAAAGRKADVDGTSTGSFAGPDTASADDLTSKSASSLETASAQTWRQWAIQGVRRRNPKVISALALVVIVLGLGGALLLASTYAWIVSRDPCEVARETAHFLQTHPRVSHLQPDFVPVVPKIVHQQWKTDKIPEGKYLEWHLKFKEFFPEPEYKHMLWTDENARELIAKDYAFFLPTYDSYEFGIQRADAVRYFFLHKYGGLYVDLDYEPLANFWDSLPKDRVALVESPYLYNERAQNSLMSSPRGDPFWLETFDMLQKRKDKPVLQATGPMFLDALMRKAKEPFLLLPCENFQRLPLHLSKEEEVSPFMSQLHRELLGRLAPMKSCGDYHRNGDCQLAKHHNTASYLASTGVLKLLWA